MPLKLVNFELGGRIRPGVVADGLVFEIPDAGSIQELIERGTLGRAEERAREKSEGIGIERVRLKAPVASPDKILLAAVNYRAHGVEQNVAPPEEPYFFTKFRSCIIGNGDPIMVPRCSKKADWEAELAVIIGKKCKYVNRREALDFVAGYTVANDVSFRDLLASGRPPGSKNNLGPNWVKGKALDSAYPLGPWLVTPDEIEDPQRLSISLKVNGIMRQDANTEDMVHPVSELIEYLSDGVTLMPGDIISTGTPAGVAVFTGVPFLKEGDVVSTTVERIGTLTNPVKVEA